MKLKENRITLFSFWSLLALGCVGSLLSAFSFFSIASFGSVLSIASYGSVLSINCYYGFLSYCDNTNSHVASRYRPPSTEDFDVRIERVVDVPSDSYTNITVFSKTNKTVVLKSIDKDIQWQINITLSENTVSVHSIQHQNKKKAVVAIYDNEFASRPLHSVFLEASEYRPGVVFPADIAAIDIKLSAKNIEDFEADDKHKAKDVACVVTWKNRTRSEHVCNEVRIKGQSSRRPIKQRPSLKIEIDSFIGMGLERRLTLNRWMTADNKEVEIRRYDVFRRHVAAGEAYPITVSVAGVTDMYALVQSPDTASFMNTHFTTADSLCEADGALKNEFEHERGFNCRKATYDALYAADIGSVTNLAAFCGCEAAVRRSDGICVSNRDAAFPHIHNGFVVETGASAATLVPWGVNDRLHECFIINYKPTPLATACLDDPACASEFTAIANHEKFVYDCPSVDWGLIGVMFFSVASFVVTLVKEATVTVVRPNILSAAFCAVVGVSVWLMFDYYWPLSEYDVPLINHRDAGWAVSFVLIVISVVSLYNVWHNGAFVVAAVVATPVLLLVQATWPDDDAPTAASFVLAAVVAFVACLALKPGAYAKITEGLIL